MKIIRECLPSLGWFARESGERSQQRETMHRKSHHAFGNVVVTQSIRHTYVRTSAAAAVERFKALCIIRCLTRSLPLYLTYTHSHRLRTLLFLAEDVIL